MSEAQPERPGPDSPADTSESELIARMRAGDRDAAVAFLWSRRDEILAMARRNLRPDDHVDRDPEDIFSTLLRRWDHYIHRGLFTAKDSTEAHGLMRTMVRRTLANVFRRGRVRRENAHLSAVDERVLDEIREVDRAALRAVIRDLDAAAYDLLVCKMQGLSSREIAERLGIHEDAVRQRWHSLRKALLTEFRADGVVDGPEGREGHVDRGKGTGGTHGCAA